MPYFWKQPVDSGVIYCDHDEDMCPCMDRPDPLRLRVRQWRRRLAWKADRLGRQLAFWQFPARIERLSIRCASLEAGLTGLGQTVGGLVAEKRVARDKEMEGGFLTYTEKLGSTDDKGVWTYSQNWRDADAEKNAALDAEEDAAGVVRTPEPVGGFHAITPLGEDERGA